MKTKLDQNDILTKFSATSRPVLQGEKVAYVPHDGSQYIVFDANQKSPVGFGVRIGAKSKTYIIQRKIGGRVIRAKIGNVASFDSIIAARKKAVELVNEMEETGRNPNVAKRNKIAAEIKLGEAFAEYRSHLEQKQPPAKPNTFRVFDRAVLKLEPWKTMRVRDLTSTVILSRFDEIAKKTRTTAEQTFRWANAAVNHAIETEEEDANNANRQPTLTYNPFNVLHTKERYRSRKQLEEEYKTKGIRSPLSVKDTLGVFLNALWKRRPENRTGCDYFLLTTLWGTRRNEGLDLKWRDRISEQESLTCSWVCPKTMKVFFFDTKNRRNHTLPLCVAALEIVKQRWELNNERATPSVWVFPARSNSPKRKVDHYTDGRSLLEYICQDAKIGHISNHDLRRTFGRIAEELVTYAVVKDLLNHQDTTDVSGRYTEVEESRLRESLQRIELHILATAPTVYNALLTPTYSPLPA